MRWALGRKAAAEWSEVLLVVLGPRASYLQVSLTLPCPAPELGP